MLALALVLFSSLAQAASPSPDLIKRTYRPPNYESQAKYFDSIFTPNDKFFVRSHLANIPKIDVKGWTLKISGDAAEKPVTFSMADLKSQFEQVEIPALAICAGNRRGLFEPHVPGVQWGSGAMGNARWKGVRLKDALAKAGIRKAALEVVFDGADTPVLDATPDFRKSLPLSKALEEDTLIAFEMNGKPLPELQGFPARLVVPGWTATYWMKQLITIQLVSKPFDGYWMKTAYRIPRGKFPSVEGKWASQENETTTPVSEIIVNSMITNVEEGRPIRKGAPTLIKGLAWDGGHGIEKVEVSSDGGKTWEQARLEQDYGKYSWRQFSYVAKFKERGEQTILARATNQTGSTQPDAATPNPAGYHNNAVQRIKVQVVE